MQEDFIGSYITGKGKFVEGKTTFQNNKVCFFILMGNTLVEVSIPLAAVEFNIKEMDYSKIYIYGGILTATNKVEAEYFKLSSLQF